MILQVAESAEAGIKVLDIINNSIHDGATKVLVVICFLLVVSFGIAIYKLFKMLLDNNDKVQQIYRDEISTLKDTVNNNTVAFNEVRKSLDVRREDIEMTSELKNGNAKLIADIADYFTNQKALQDLIFNKMFDAHAATRLTLQTDLQNFARDIMSTLEINKQDIIAHRAVFLNALDALKQTIIDLDESIDNESSSVKDHISNKTDGVVNAIIKDIRDTNK